MAGHSQFKNIMVRKGKQDAKRGKVFTKIAREIISAVRSGMPDAASNPRLRSAIQWAREENMPRDKIDAAIKRGSGNNDADNFETIRYEGYGPGGVAVIVQALTDNRNRTAPEMRTTFTKHGGNLGETGSVSFMFDYVGVILYAKAAASEDDMLEAAIESGADNCESDAESHTVTTSIESFLGVREALDKRFGAALSAKLSWVPKMTSAVNEEQANQVLKLIEMLEDNDDVQEVFSNVELPQAVLEKLKRMTRILGVDPGLQHTGWGIIMVKTNQLTFVDCGVIHSDTKLETPERLKQIHDGLIKIIDLHKPDEAAVEETFINKNPMSSLKLGHARGAILLSLSLANLSVYEYSTNLVKKSVVGRGHADKTQVAMMVKTLLPTSKAKSADASDALAVAIAHAHHRTHLKAFA